MSEVKLYRIQQRNTVVFAAVTQFHYIRLLTAVAKDTKCITTAIDLATGNTVATCDQYGRIQ